MKRFLGLVSAGALFILLGTFVSRAQEVTYSAGPGTGAQNLQGLGFSWADVNKDGYLDLFIEPDNLIFNRIGSFSRAVSSGVVYNAATVGTTFADFNGDGYPDVLVTQGATPPLLYQDSAGTGFINVTATSGALATITSGSTGQMYGVAAADYDRDGYLDVAWAGAANQAGGDANTGGGPDGKLRLLKGGAAGFTNVGTTSSSPVIDTTKFFESWNPAFVDVNNDGYPDLFLPSFRNGINKGVSRTVLYLNDGNGHFILPPSGTGPADTGLVVDDTVRHYSAIASAWADFDNDGIMDVALSGLANDSVSIKGIGKVPSNFRLLKGKGDGTFTDVTVASGITYNSSTRGLSWGDYNNDGYIDLLQGGGFAPPIVWRNNGNGTFTNVSSLIGIPSANFNSRSCAFIDYDNDGFMDIYAAAGGGDGLLHNSGNLNNWIAFRPQGAGHNMMAIGARFTVYTGTKKQIRNIEAGGSGGATSGNNVANFGIGTTAAVDSVTVQWPDGPKQTFVGLAINRYWTIKEGSVIPSAPVLASPANAATNVASTVTLIWNPGAGATGYHVQVSLDQTFADPKMMAVDDATVTDTTRVARLGLGSTYYWRVAAMNGGFASAYTAVNSFSTVATAASIVPTLIAPVNGAQNQAGNLKLVVGKTSDAAQFNWQISTLPSFNGFSVNDSTVDTTQTVPLVPGRTYYWRVRGVNSLGASAFSVVDTFAVMAAPAIPALLTPANNAVNVRSDTLVLVWHLASLASSYVVEVARVGSTVDYTVTDTTLKLLGLQKLTNYTWKVQSVNIGGSSLFSGLNTFTTIVAAPAAPALVLPAANAQSVNRLAKFVWNSSVNATKYHLQVAKDNAFASIVQDTVIGFDTTVTLSKPLNSDSLFYWRVSGLDIGGEGSFSAARAFTCGEVLSIEQTQPATPVVYALHQNYPNPFNPSTTISYDIPKSSYVSLKIFDVLGRVVASLVDGVQAPSAYRIEWNANNVSTGVYFLRIQARAVDGTGNFSTVRKLLLMK